MLAQYQRGITTVVVAVAMVAVLAIAGLALDISHLTRNKSGLQSSIDAAALAAAKVLDQTNSPGAATTAANNTWVTNAAAFPELNQALAGMTLTVQYSNTLNPFAPGSLPERYVRVIGTNFQMNTSLSRVLAINTLTTRASAVAGPSPAIGSACNLAPMLVCGNPAAGAPNYGFTQGVLTVLKIASGGNSTIGPGNFQLVRLNGNGASVVRENLAGSYQGCVNQGTAAETQPGNVVGPVAQGLNTRFGVYSGGGMNSTDYPPDVVTREPNPLLTYNDNTQTIRQGATVVTNASEINYNYQTYLNDITSGNYDNAPAPGGNGAFLRRELAVPIADCSGSNQGQSTIPVLAFGCFFLIQRADQQGQNSYVYGQYLQSCAAGGRPGPAPVAGPGPYVIQLYKDPDSPDS